MQPASFDDGLDRLEAVVQKLESGQLGLEEALLAGQDIEIGALVAATAQKEIAAAFTQYGFGNLGGVVESLGGRYTYGQCRVVRAALQAK